MTQFDIDHLPSDDPAFHIENTLFEFIKSLPVPENDVMSMNQFKMLYEMVPLNIWTESDLVFDLGNYIMRYRPDLISLGIRINVQVNLFLRSIEKYAEDPAAVFDKVGHAIGAFALTEEDSGVLSGLIVDTTWTKEDDGYILKTHDSKKNWISQGMLAEYAIVYASNESNKENIRIFLVDLNTETGITKTKIDVLPVNKTLDMAKLDFTDCKVPESALLENSKKSTKMELLNGIFFGRYMIAEATISAMLGQIEHIEKNINQTKKTREKFEKLGFTKYLSECHDAFYHYKCHLYLTRNVILTANNENTLFLTNCYKIYTVEKSIEVFQKLQMMFGMRAATSDLRFENLLLHKVAEGDTYVLRVSLINSLFKSGWFNVFTKPGFTIKDIYTLYVMETKREKYEYIMNHFKEISDTIIASNVPPLF